jgi:hypothetical protein
MSEKAMVPFGEMREMCENTNFFNGRKVKYTCKISKENRWPIEVECTAKTCKPIRAKIKKELREREAIFNRVKKVVK